jgi:hypothetical protein
MPSPHGGGSVVEVVLVGVVVVLDVVVVVTDGAVVDVEVVLAELVVVLDVVVVDVVIDVVGAVDVVEVVEVDVVLLVDVVEIVEVVVVVAGVELVVVEEVVVVELVVDVVVVVVVVGATAVRAVRTRSPAGASDGRGLNMCGNVWPPSRLTSCSIWFVSSSNRVRSTIGCVRLEGSIAIASTSTDVAGPSGGPVVRSWNTWSPVSTPSSSATPGSGFVTPTIVLDWTPSKVAPTFWKKLWGTLGASGSQVDLISKSPSPSQVIPSSSMSLRSRSIVAEPVSN